MAEKTQTSDSDYVLAGQLAEEGQLYLAALAYSRCMQYGDSGEKCLDLWMWLRRCNQGVIACCEDAIAVKRDGTVVATSRRSAVAEWKDIRAVAAGKGWFAGLKADGTVAVTDRELQNQVRFWTDIVQIAAGAEHLVGLKKDGTAVAAGSNGFGQCGVEGWEYVEEIAAGEHHTLGRTGWGAVYAAGDNSKGQCKVADEGGVAGIACGCDHTVTLGWQGELSIYGSGEAGDWSRLTGADKAACAVFSGSAVMGLYGNGRPFVAGYRNQVEQQREYESVFADWEWNIEDYNMDRGAIRACLLVEDWTDILALASGRAVTVGLCADGTVRTAFAKPCGYEGRSRYFEEPIFSEKDVADWKDLRVVLTREDAERYFGKEC